MRQEESLEEFLERANREFMAHISLDCVVFGFHAGQLKILLLKMKHEDRRALPGGFVRCDETLEEAAIRTLQERTYSAGQGDTWHITTLSIKCMQRQTKGNLS